MPTYADLYNERLRALGQSGPSNPVRLTISKGDYVWDPQQDRFRYEEKWEEEQLMEAEELHDDDHLTASVHSATSDSRGSSPGPIAALQPTAVLTPSAAVAHSPSLWVLDTNTLMSCLDLLKALFAALLTRNIASAAAAGSHQTHLAPSPIKLVIPYVVVSELDGLKLTRRKDDSGRQVASQARDANHWLLTAVQKQKRVPIDASGSNLPEQLWPLFLQTSSHYNRSKQSRSQGSRWTFDDPLSCDDQIVKYCAELKHQTHSSVFFCSDDINARTKAESESIDSLGMRELANALRTGFAGVQSSERKWELVAEALIEQWEYQIGSTPTQPLPQHSQPSFAHEGQFTSPGAPSLQPGNTAHFADVEAFEVDMDTEEPSLQPTEAHIYPGGAAMSTPPTASAPPRFSSLAHFPGRSTSDSIHSPHNRTRPERTKAPSSRQRDTAVPATSNGEPYQADRSETLNPQISWEDLVQQLGSSSREAAKPGRTRR